MDTDTGSALTKKLFSGRLYDEFFVSDYGRIEATRATRYNTRFSIILIGADGGGEDRLLDSREEPGLLEKLVSTVLASVRSCDITGLTGSGRILVILPETDYFGSLVATKKLTRAISSSSKAGSQRKVLLSSATFPRDGRTFPEMCAAAERRLTARKDSLWEKLGCGEKLFWEIVGSLSGRNISALDCASFDAGAGQDLSEFFLDQINELIIKEIARSPQTRGIMYFGARNLSSSLPAVKNLSAAGATATKIFLVGELENSVWESRNTMPLALDDPRLKEIFFTLLMSEETSYALICKENWGSTFSCFHTSDPVLVEGLITKFQSEYSLQEQLG